MEARFRGLPYRPWLSCIVTKLQRHDQTIVRNCTVVMVAVVRQGYVKIFKFQGGRILIASFNYVKHFTNLATLYAGTVTTFKILYPIVFKELLGRNKLYDSLTFIEVNLINLFTLLYACVTHFCLSVFFIAIGKRLEGKVF